jgi:hypothetical protein
VILKGADVVSIRRIARRAREAAALCKSLYLEIDIDPVDML